ncbi:MAG: hypothetical protein CMM57_09815 [Rhodospirillaceae bacterium]|nr:hypothetical protein [Rhodospirillaceae bacterium]
MPLNNVGREGHTYYKYICDNYEKLPEYTFFLQGYPFDHSGNIICDLTSHINLIKNKSLEIGCKAGRIAIRDQKGRWGSCSSNGNLAFSWRLIMAPSFVLDYVVAHEVAHLVEHNHSRAFWNVVRSLTNHTDRGRIWLKHKGLQLHRYGK